MMIPIFIGVIVLIFLILHLSPGDPARMVLGEQASVEQINAFREAEGLNDPVIIQLGRYILNLLHGDFGTSYMSKASVLNDILPETGYTASFWL